MATGATGGRLLVIECVLPPPGAPGFSRLLDLQMLVMTGGRERTVDEYQRLLEAGGFRLEQVTDTDCPESILEARPS
jgi:hypothetical protein